MTALFCGVRRLDTPVWILRHRLSLPSQALKDSEIKEEVTYCWDMLVTFLICVTESSEEFSQSKGGRFIWSQRLIQSVRGVGLRVEAAHHRRHEDLA